MLYLDAVKIDTLKKVKRGIDVNYFDDLKIENTIHHIWGPHISPLVYPQFFSFCFLRQGKLIVELDGREFEISGPSVLWAVPGHSYRFVSGGEGKVETLWLDMSGTRADRIASALSVLHFLWRPVRDDLHLFLLLKNILEMVKQKEKCRNKHRITLLVEEILALLYDEETASRESSGMKRTVLEAAKLFRAHPGKKHNINLLAMQHNISYDVFRKNFKKYTGLAPGEYIMKERMLLAVELLKNSQQSIKEISFACGFSDVSCFSRMFHKKCSCYPRQYRQKTKLQEDSGESNRCGNDKEIFPD